MEENKKEYIYLTNAFSLFLVKSLDRIRIAANLTAKAIKAGFKFAFAYPSEKNKRDKVYKQFCEKLDEELKKGID